MSEIKLTKDNFQAEVLDAALPVLVDFWATWCGPCMMLAPIIEEIAKEKAGVIKVGKVNVDEEAELAQAFRIASIPTVVLIKDGKIVGQSVGYRTKDQLLKTLGL